MRDLKKEELLEVGFKEADFGTFGKFLYLRLTDDGDDIHFYFRLVENAPEIISIDLLVPGSIKTMSEEEFLKGYITIPENAIKRYKGIMQKLGIEE